MLRVYFFFFINSISLFVYSQKSIIDSSSYSGWKRITSPYLTNDGKFVAYQLVFASNIERLQIVKSVDNNWIITEKEGKGIFANGDKYYLYKKNNNDSLIIYKLGSESTENLKVRSYDASSGNLLFYQMPDGDNLFIKNIESGKLRQIKDVGIISSYRLMPEFSGILLVTKEKDDRTVIKWVDLLQFTIQEIGSNIKDFTIISGAKYIAYLSEYENDIKIVNLFCPKSKVIDRIRLNKSLSEGRFVEVRNFTSKDKELILEIAPAYKLSKPRKDTEADLILWSYKDRKLSNNGVYGDIVSSELFKLSIETKRVSIFSENEIERDSLKNNGGNVSPSGKFIFYRAENDYWSYEIDNGIYRNLTEKVHNNWFSPENGDSDVFYPMNSGVEAWVEGEEAVIVVDEFDVWKVSLNNAYLPKCLTNNFGRRNRISFYLVGGGRKNSSIDYPKVSLRDSVFIMAFDNQTKENGFYLLSNKLSTDPLKLTMNSAMYWIRTSPLSFPTITSSNIQPQKAKDAKVFLVAKSTASSSQNLYITTDFKRFQSVTDYYPEKKFNWLKTELVSWKTPTGRSLQGVLYKPENFDATKKYPVIFYSYRKASINLNAYMYPVECPGCIIDIPSYVSDGYLVFTPDIYFTKAGPGKDALDAVVSAAKFLSSFPYIHTNKIGIVGCSFSGLTTNYIVTHTNVFAAAVSASGLSDLISGYNSVNNIGEIKQSQFEKGGAYQLGTTLWKDKEGYIDNSPIFNVDKLSTPLLLMHTKNDNTIPLSNAIELFLASRRLKKKSWLLQYEKGNHVLHGAEATDFMKRMKQFFDFYLKDTTPPKWMIENSASIESIEDGLQMDFTGKVP